MALPQRLKSSIGAPRSACDRDEWGTDFRFRSDILSAFSSRLRSKRVRPTAPVTGMLRIPVLISNYVCSECPDRIPSIRPHPAERACDWSEGTLVHLKIPLEFRSAPLGGTKGTKGFQKGAAVLAGPLEIKIVEIFYVSFVALPQRLKAYLGAPRWEPNDRKRVRSKWVLSSGPHSLGSDTNQNRNA